MALHDAVEFGLRKGWFKRTPITGQVAAISMGEVGGQLLLDLDYPEDSSAQVDLNLVGSADGQIIEVQGTGERATFSRDQLNALLDMGQRGIDQLLALQAQAVAAGTI